MSQNVGFFNNMQNQNQYQMNPMQNISPMQNMNPLNNLSNMSSTNSMNIITPVGVLGNMSMGVNSMTSTNISGTPNHLNPNLMPISSTPPLNTYKMPYPNAMPFKQPTPNLLGNQMNNNFLGFSMATPPPMQINEMSNQLNMGMNLQQIPGVSENDVEKIVGHILNLRNHDKREDALHELSKKRESFANLAPYLWYSVGTLAILFLNKIFIFN